MCTTCCICVLQGLVIEVRLMCSCESVAHACAHVQAEDIASAAGGQDGKVRCVQGASFVMRMISLIM